MLKGSTMNTQERQQLAENQQHWAANAGTYHVSEFGDINVYTVDGPRLIAYSDEIFHGLFSRDAAERIAHRLNTTALEQNR
jgi:hypothetical protein